MLIFKQFSFDSAHYLPNVPADHKCRNTHGHTYRMIIYLEGNLIPEKEWVMDFSEVKKVVAPIIDEIDHKLLNEIPGMENPDRKSTRLNSSHRT